MTDLVEPTHTTIKHYWQTRYVGNTNTLTEQAEEYGVERESLREQAMMYHRRDYVHRYRVCVDGSKCYVYSTLPWLSVKMLRPGLKRLEEWRRRGPRRDWRGVPCYRLSTREGVFTSAWGGGDE